MQMYRVLFQTHYVSTVDKGDVLVCASNNQAAIDMVINLLNLPATRTQCEAQRVKPSIWELERKEIRMGEAKPSRRNYGLAAPEPPPVRHLVNVSATITGRDEGQVIRRLAKKLNERSNNERNIDQTENNPMLVDCKPLQSQGELHGMAAVETYRAKRFVGGVRRDPDVKPKFGK